MGTQTGRMRNTEKARKQTITFPDVTNILRFTRLAKRKPTVARRMNRNATAIDMSLAEKFTAYVKSVLAEALAAATAAAAEFIKSVKRTPDGQVADHRGNGIAFVFQT